MKRSGLALVALVLAALGLMAAKGLLLTLPSPPEQPQAGQFDANRAAERLALVLGDQRPHPVDSMESDAVRDRLLAEMRRVGLQPRITDEMACNSSARSRNVNCARVRNIIATLGPEEGRQLVLSAHYDSTYAGPGASDAGIGVATLLEVAELLRGQPLRRPVTFLFNEGEEMGLIGARAFMERDLVARRTEALINLEARGTTGPAIMFETSLPNARAIAAFARGSDRPVGNSMTADFYRLIPNSTDVTVFAERPWTILNFAVIGNETRYHTAGDDMAALDRRSLQHMGEQTLGLTRSILSDGVPSGGGTRIYADLLGRQLIVLPPWIGYGLLGLLLIVFGAAAWRRDAPVRAQGLIALCILLGPALAWVMLSLLGWLRPGEYWRAYPLPTFLAVYACAVASALLVLGGLGGKVARHQLRAAFWFTFTLIGALFCLVAPGAAILFLLPPLVAALGTWRESSERVTSWIAILLLFLTLGPVIGLAEDLLVAGPFWPFAAFGSLLMLPILIEGRPLLNGISKARVAAGALVLLIAAWLLPAFAPAASEDRQRRFGIEYVQSGREAHWRLNTDAGPVPPGMTAFGTWRRGALPGFAAERWIAPALLAPIAPPVLEPVTSESMAEGRRVRLRLRTNGSETVTLQLPFEAEIVRAGAEDFIRPVGGPEASGRYNIRCAGRSCDGALLTFETKVRTPLQATLIGFRRGLPAGGERLQAARPPLSRPQYSPDGTWVVSGARL